MGKKSKAAAAAAAKKEKELSSSSSSSSTAAAAAKAEAESSNAGKDAPSALTYALYAVCFCAWVAAVYFASRNAYEIRLYAIKTYGKVIHEFDPWFNFRATQYLHMNGWTKFFHWYDYMSWYPLGRPVGTTIYPGMQISAVAIWHALKNLNMEMTLNDVCVYMPAWYGVSATLFLGLLTSECSGSWAAGAAGSIIYAIIPAHIMRSVGGGYDNESVALTCMCMTYYLWARSLRNDPKCKNGEATRDSYIFGVLGGLAYIYMVATWGGFVFVINLVGVHAGLLCALGRYSSKLHRAYSLFYFIGTAGALRVPVVGMGPLKSMEQLGPLFVFLGMQLLEFCEIQRRSKNLSLTQLFVLRLKVFGVAGAVVVAGIAALYPTGYFGPLSARVRGLFVKHTRTGNPLVDSVAEHQPASAKAYEQYLHHVYHLAPVGLAISCLKLSDANTFLIVYAVVAYYFSSKMARLIVLLGPVAAALGGVAVGFAYDQLFFVPMATLGFREAGFKVPKEVGRTIFSNFAAGDNDEDESSSSHSNGGSDGAEDDGGQAKSKLAKKAARRGRGKRKSEFDKLQDNLSNAQKVADSFLSNRYVLFVRLALAMLAFTRLVPSWNEFFKYSHDMARGMSHPQLMFQAQLRDGTTIIVDDYREAYWWLRDNTPADSRVMSWWDYGYQIAGIANRTTLADGNTWNHEHIATLGRILVSTEKESHRIARHLADYVLVWAGGGGDDLAKSPHMARIGNSVFPDLCPGDPTCSHFGFYQGGTPTPMMEKSLLYKLTQYGIRPEVKIDPNRYTHAFTSKYGKVRIFKINSISRKSKKWIADPKNRLCDVPGSWMCRGQYPPALDKLIASRKNFAQLEDFNRKKSKEDAEYQEAYHARMEGRHPQQAGHGGDKESKPSVAKGIKYVGCFSNEDQLGADKEYIGGQSGANANLLLAIARKKSKKYFAVARNGDDGHSFVFDKQPTGKKMADSGCLRSCLDAEDVRCGCTDAACGKVKKQAGEKHLRRWVVYEVKKGGGERDRPPGTTKKKKKTRKKKKKKKST